MLALAACSSAASDAAPRVSRGAKLDAKTGLCVTRGGAMDRVTEPTVRAVKPGTGGDAAALTFTFRGDAEHKRALASGQERRQLGLKLRAQDGCNLVYVMWRLDPRPALEVSLKVNPGQRTHAECGAGGYTKVKPIAEAAALPALAPGDTHTLRAELAGDELRVWIDDEAAWRGTLPEAARALAGPAGLRSDNLAFDLVRFDAPGEARAPVPECGSTVGD